MKRDEAPAGAPLTTVRIGSGIAPDAVAYVRRRLAELAHYAPRAIDSMGATVTRPRDRKQPHAVQVRASLAVGRHTLRVEASEPNLRAALDAACDRLRRRLTELPHGRRHDYVPHRRNTMTEPTPRKPGLRIRRADVDGHRPWVLEDEAGILEVAESVEVLAEDHPEAHIVVGDDQP